MISKQRKELDMTADKQFVKFAVRTAPDARRNCYLLVNSYSDGSWTETGFGFDTYEAAEDEAAHRNR